MYKQINPSAGAHQAHAAAQTGSHPAATKTNVNIFLLDFRKK